MDDALAEYERAEAERAAATVAGNVRRLRTKKGLSISDLAAMTELSVTALEGIERGSSSGRPSNPRLSTLRTLATSLGVAPGVLIEPTAASPQLLAPEVIPDDDFTFRRQVVDGLNKVLADGAWHPRDEVIRRVARAVAPGRAMRVGKGFDYIVKPDPVVQEKGAYMVTEELVEQLLEKGALNSQGLLRLPTALVEQGEGR